MAFEEYTTNSRFFNYFDAAERQKNAKWEFFGGGGRRSASGICKKRITGVNYLYDKNIAAPRRAGAPVSGSEKQPLFGTMTVFQLAVGGFDRNFTYLGTDGGEALLIDPTGDAEIVNSALETLPNLRMRYILVTHGHADHVELVDAMRRRFPEAELCGHPGNRHAERKLADNETLELGGSRVETLYTPGHSRDSVCYFADRSSLFTGDTLFVDYVGFARRPEGLYSSLKRLAKLPESTTVYPGHDYGCVPHRTLAEEKRHNPFFNCPTLDEFKQQLEDMD